MYNRNPNSKMISDPKTLIKHLSIEKETRSSRLMPESEIQDWTKSVTDNSVSNFESFKHGNTEDDNQVSNFKENVKGEKYFEHIHENFVPNDNDHVLSTSVTEENEVRAVSNTFCIRIKF